MKKENKLHDEEFMAMYKIAIEDIRDNKHQQWRIIQLTLLAIAAIVSIHKYFPCSVTARSLKGAVWFVGVAGIIFILSFAYSLSKYRKKKEAFREHFSDAAKEIEKAGLWDCWFERVIDMFQTTIVFAGLFSIFIGIAMYIAISAINKIP